MVVWSQSICSVSPIMYVWCRINQEGTTWKVIHFHSLPFICCDHSMYLQFYVLFILSSHVPFSKLVEKVIWDYSLYCPPYRKRKFRKIYETIKSNKNKLCSSNVLFQPRLYSVWFFTKWCFFSLVTILLKFMFVNMEFIVAFFVQLYRF